MIEKAYSRFTALSRLCKFRISLPVALTTFTGYLIGMGGIVPEIIFPVAGVFLLASAASALNQIQEYKTDLRMPRTRNRPIPAGKISRKAALAWSIFFAVTGTAILWYFSGWLPAFLGLLTFVWYNGIYTPLKRITAFAAVPGGVVGALPPVIGWVAGGGDIAHPAAFALAMFFFIGQVPHFWLLLLRFGEQYELAGIKSLTARLSHVQIRRLTFMWIVATAVSAILLPGFYAFHHKTAVWAVWILSGLLVAVFVKLLKPSLESVRFKSSFLLINLYYLLIMITFGLDVLI